MVFLPVFWILCADKPFKKKKNVTISIDNSNHCESVEFKMKIIGSGRGQKMDMVIFCSHYLSWYTCLRNGEDIWSVQLRKSSFVL